MELSFTVAAGHVVADKYRLERVLGKGATGTVWGAIQLGLERPVAIKLLHPQIAAREDACVRFSREARVAASLDHPSSVAILDFGDDRGVLYLVMELIGGESLRARMSRGAVPFAQSVSIVRQVASALGAAHRIRLVHRDIKPENVILPGGLPAQPAKVVDFGLAFIVDPDDAQHMGRVTLDGSVTGTPAYMSPEQVRGGSIGPASDIYSLGCMLYELIAGRPPFAGVISEILTRHAYAPPIALRQLELVETPPTAIDELVQQMLSKSPNSRPTAGRVGHVLAQFEAPDDARVGRTSAPVIERALRAVTVSRSDVVTEEHGAQGATLAVGAIGDLSAELELTLAASGIQVQRWETGMGTEQIVWAANVPVEQLAALVAAGKVVVTDVAAGDAATLPALIHAGVADAIVRPHQAEDLVRRLWRAHRLRTGLA